MARNRDFQKSRFLDQENRYISTRATNLMHRARLKQIERDYEQEIKTLQRQSQAHEEELQTLAKKRHFRRGRNSWIFIFF